MSLTPVEMNMYAITSLTATLTMKAEQKENSKAVKPIATENH